PADGGVKLRQAGRGPQKTKVLDLMSALLQALDVAGVAVRVRADCMAGLMVLCGCGLVRGAILILDALTLVRVILLVVLVEVIILLVVFIILVILVLTQECSQPGLSAFLDFLVLAGSQCLDLRPQGACSQLALRGFLSLGLIWATALVAGLAVALGGPV